MTRSSFNAISPYYASFYVKTSMKAARELVIRQQIARMLEGRDEPLVDTKTYDLPDDTFQLH